MSISRRRHYTTIGILVFVVIILGSIVFIPFSQRIIPLHSPDQTDATPKFLTTEELVTIPSSGTTSVETKVVEPVLFEYVAVTDSCGPHFSGECVRARSGPGTEYEVQVRLRTGMVLRVGGKVTRDDGTTWYKIDFAEEWLRYPERLKGDWYVAEPYVTVLYDEGDKTIWTDDHSTTSLKRIVVDRSEQTLTAYEDDLVFMDIKISTGLELTPTPRGTFRVFKKTPSRYMQGPLPGLADQQVYDLPGVPWNLYFTEGGAVIHGAYWHDSFGSPYSHGCVNLSPQDARTLYTWADLGITVTVQD